MIDAIRGSLAALVFSFPPFNALRAKLVQLQDRNARLKRVVDRLKPLDRTPGMPLASQLQQRFEALRQQNDEEPAARERDFVLRSTAYAEASSRLRFEPPRGCTLHTHADLSWWIPDDGNSRSLAARIAAGWLPLDDIARVRRVTTGGVMLDIGANIGTTAIPRVILGDAVRVYAAEAQTTNYDCLVANVLANGLAGRVLPDRLAIASWNGEASLRETSQMGSHHLASGSAAARRGVVVPCSTLDAWVNRLQIDPASISFVKVDVEGWDAHVLAGAPHLRALRHVAWQLEVNTTKIPRTGISLQEFCALAQASFTHFDELDYDVELRRPVNELPAHLEHIEARGSFSNLLFYSLG